METLITYSNRKISQLRHSFERYLMEDIDWEQRLIVLLGHRGSGKTTLMLQRMKQSQQKAIYLTLDHLYFESNRLITTIESLYDQGYRHFYVDEVHKYLHWSIDLKNAYDAFNDVQIVATGSSILEISKGKADLSRRSVVYHLYGLSFREFLNLTLSKNFPPIELPQLINEHSEIAEELIIQVNLKADFNSYLKSGYYPFFNDGSKSYSQKLMEVSNLIIEVDIMAYEDINHSTVRNLKKLLFLISQSVPYKPNVSKLAEALHVSRNTILKMLDILHRAQVLHLLKTDAHGNSFLQKPEKVYLQNTNLSYLFTDKPNAGNIRETFFLNQVSVKHEVLSSRYADFLVNNKHTFEVGGPNKNAAQISGVGEAYLAVDGIEIGQSNKIPLWMFGFLY
ncbi:MAG: ATP-binding protein [Flavobacteriales bacterium]|nr:MAG: ATP-binding protein [Flavobacteriales bacterium]